MRTRAEIGKTVTVCDFITRAHHCVLACIPPTHDWGIAEQMMYGQFKLDEQVVVIIIDQMFLPSPKAAVR